MKFLGFANSTQGTFLRPPSHVRRRRPNEPPKTSVKKQSVHKREPQSPLSAPSYVGSIEKLRSNPCRSSGT
jgi:hypothetical protein